MGYSYLLVAILAEVAATSSLKASNGFTDIRYSLVVVIGYAIAFYFLSLTLRYIPVGVAYAIWSGIGTVLITLAAWFLHGQRLDAAAIAGISLITLGVVVLNLFSTSQA